MFRTAPFPIARGNYDPMVLLFQNISRKLLNSQETVVLPIRLSKLKPAITIKSLPNLAGTL